MEKELEQLGFSRSEAKVYVALLDVGPTTAGDVIKKCGLHRNIVYECLNKLKDKKLVSQTIKSGKKFFTPLHPEVILRDEKKKLDMAKKIVPELERKLKKDKQQITIYEGRKEYFDFLIRKSKEMPKGSTIYIIGGTGKWYKLIDEKEYKEYEEVRLRNKVRIKLIYYRRQYKIDKVYETKLKRKLIESRMINEDLETPAYTIIWHDGINIAIFSEPITCIEIKNKDIAKAYLNYFNLLWKLGK